MLLIAGSVSEEGLSEGNGIASVLVESESAASWDPILGKESVNAGGEIL
jgi:hypothetical protein